MKIVKNKILSKICLSLILIIALVLGCMGTQYGAETQEKTEEEKINVMYNTHIQNEGWEKDFSKKDGQMSGTQGKCYRLEAIKIKLENAEGISIKYQTHVENEGWQDWKKDGQMSGTQGKSYRLEGIKIKLENTDKYSVMYRVHIQDIGWQDWKSDGELAGTTGLSKRLEAIEIKIVDKIEKGKLTIETPIQNAYYNNTNTIKISGWKMANISDTKIRVTLDENYIKDIEYAQRQDVIDSVQDYGTIKENPNPGFNFDVDITKLTDGGHKLKIELVTAEGKILEVYNKIIQIDRSIHIQYSAHVENIGWQNWRENGELAGTEGKCLRVEALKINAVNLPEGMTIKYQTHVQDIGWQSWKSNGELAGTQGQSKRVEAIRMEIEGNSEYSITYRLHVQDIGWQEWCYDGETAGTEGILKRVEAIEIKIVPKIKETKIEISLDNPINQISATNQKVSGWIMANVENVSFKILIDDQEVDISELKRITRQDIINSKKGFGNERIYNKTPGFELYIDFSEYSLETHNITIQALYKDNVIKEIKKSFTIKPKIEYGKGTYGMSGLKVAGDWRGTELPYYKYGSGPNVFYATFAIHGFEDLWSKDGQELVTIANNFYQRLIELNDYNIADKWTIYIFPGVNQDGLNYGYTNNGPGRTTLFSEVPSHQGIDMNRCWQVGNTYQRYTDSRNYNGTEGFQAYEARYLRDFLINHKSKNGKTLLVDLHGWTQQLIGDSGICSYYQNQFPENDGSAIGRYGTGYLVNWARSTLGARSALIELPNDGVNGHQAVVNKNFSNRYIEATLDMLRNI